MKYLNPLLVLVIPVGLMLEEPRIGLPAWLPFAMLALGVIVAASSLARSPLCRLEHARRRSLRRAERFLAEHERPAPTVEMCRVAICDEPASFTGFLSVGSIARPTFLCDRHAARREETIREIAPAGIVTLTLHPIESASA